MASGQIHAVFRQIHRLFGAGSVSGLSEGQLLARFVERKDESAFEALVSRFGPMVLGVCRQVLDDPHAVEDAFQATFLILVRRAATIRDPNLLGNWIYGVTLKVAKRARADLARRRSREKEADAMTESLGVSPSFDDPDLGPILHEELARLPEKYRRPVVLCYLEGRTHEEAARALNWPVGTVKGRLSRAKELLRGRLGRRGVTASAALVASSLAKTAEAAVPPLLLDQTVKAAMGVAAGGAIAAGLVSASAMALSEGVVTSMSLAKMKFAAVAIVGLGVASGGVALGMQGLGGGGGPQEATKAGVKSAEAPQEKAYTPKQAIDPPAARAKEEGRALNEKLIADTPLPEDIPLSRLNEERVRIAKQTLDQLIASYEGGMVPIERLIQAAQTYAEARAAAAADQPARVKALEDYVRLARNLADREKARHQTGQTSLASANEAELKVIDARILLANARAGEASGPQMSGAAAKDNPNLNDGVESDNPVIDKKIVEVLRKPISLPFPNETPLEEVIKYLQNATTGPGFDQGIPIYVDPSGLELAEKTMASPIHVNLEGIMLKTGLRLMLKQLNMGYYVKHGLVIITALEDEDYKDAVNPGWRQQEMKMRREAGPAVQGGFGGGFGGLGGSMSGRPPQAAPPAQPPADPGADTKGTPARPQR